MTPSSVDERTRRRLEARLATEQADARLPSVVAGIVRRSGLVWWGGAGSTPDGPPHADVQYRIGSITKTMTAVCVLRLRDEGLLGLDDPVRRHVDYPDAETTLANLLAHASGLRAETASPWWERTPGGNWSDLEATTLRTDAQRHSRGRFHYSNVGYAVLGQVVATLRGAPWRQVLRQEVLEPLGMGRTTARPQPPAAPGLAVHPWADVVLAEPEHDAGAMGPAGQLWSTVTDLARWAAFLAGDTGSVLEAETLAEMRQPRVLQDVPGEPWTVAHGLGLQIWNDSGRRACGHGGSMPGFLARIRVDIDSGDAVVVMANATAGLAADFDAQLLGIIHDEEPPPPRPWSPAAVGTDLLDLAGVWYWATRPYVLRVDGPAQVTLGPVQGPGRASRFVRTGDGSWTGLEGYYAGERLEIVRGAHGRVDHLDLASFVFTRSPYDPATAIPGGVDTGGWHAPPRGDEPPS